MKGFEKGDKVLYSGKTVTVTNVIKAEDANGWQDMVTVTDGTDTFEIGEYDCVFAMPDSGDEARNLHAYMEKNGVYCEIHPTSKRVELLIEWGDWKHDHGFADYLMGLVGYRVIGQTVTEDNGSDCYSAVHAYLRSTEAA